MITYKIAASEEEFAQIHSLNYRTFVEEIPQHEQNDKQILIDRFHLENTYLIACHGSKVVGMIAVRDRRPFSLESKLDDLDDHLPPHQSVCELRLLAVEKEYRHSRLFFGLAQHLARFCLLQKYDLAIISGTVRQLKLYKQMGFLPFARLVGTEEALYQPMYLTRDTYKASLAGRLQPRPLTFLPGPVPVRDEVKASFQSKAISHRSSGFKKTMYEVRKRLCELTNSSYVQVLLGSGTLANDCIAAQLGQKNARGLILVNGEFGERLIDHGRRAKLEFSILKKTWGQPFSKEEVNSIIQGENARWLWAVQGETSTGMLNDLNMLKDISEENGIPLCLDVISVIGALPMDLAGIYLASGVSGKAIGGYTGLSFVFHQEDILPSPSIPRYLDLGCYQFAESIPYSHSSNLVSALLTALGQDSSERYKAIQKNFSLLYGEIEAASIPIIVPQPQTLPHIITIQLPKDISSLEFGELMSSCGYKLHYESSYLVSRNWLQISIIGHEEEDIRSMLAAFKACYYSSQTMPHP